MNRFGCPIVSFGSVGCVLTRRIATTSSGKMNLGLVARAFKNVLWFESPARFGASSSFSRWCHLSLTSQLEISQREPRKRYTFASACFVGIKASGRCWPSMENAIPTGRHQRLNDHFLPSLVGRANCAPARPSTNGLSQRGLKRPCQPINRASSARSVLWRKPRRKPPFPFPRTR